MTGSRGFRSTGEAARLLGVSQRRVQQLLDNGELVRVARGLVDASSVDRYLAVRRASRTRAWAEPTAWAAIALLSRTRVDWLGAAQASRLRAALRVMTDPADLIGRTRDRAVVHIYAGHPAAAGRLIHDVATTDHAGLGLTPNSVDRVDGYLDAARLRSTAAALGLREEPGGSLVVRATTFDFATVTTLADELPLAALDAATSLDPRERGVGERAIAMLLSEYP